MSDNGLMIVEDSTAPSTIQPLQTVDVQAAEDFNSIHQQNRVVWCCKRLHE